MNYLEYIYSLKKYVEMDLSTFDEIIANSDPYTYDPNDPSTFTTRAPYEGIYPSNAKGTVLIPMSLMLFSCMDVLGYLSRSIGGYRDSEDNLKEFYNNVPSFISSKKETNIKFLYQFYRNGMAHTFFPKVGMGISYLFFNNNLFYKFEYKGERLLALNVRILIVHFKEGLENIEKYAINNSIMESRYKTMISEYEEKLRKFIIDDLDV